jgi:hypothetical protein
VLTRAGSVTMMGLAPIPICRRGGTFEAAPAESNVGQFLRGGAAEGALASGDETRRADPGIGPCASADFIKAR